MTKLAILGASGHGKVLAEIAELNGYDNITFYDDRWQLLSENYPWPVIGSTEQLLSDCTQYDACIVGIGNNTIRLEKQQLLVDAGANITSLLHPKAFVSRYVTLGVGVCVMANASVNIDSTIEDGCIVNTGASVDHDCHLSRGVHISPGASLAGNVSVGEGSWVGIGASVKQSIIIGKKVIVGAGAAVVNDIADELTVVGVPAKELIS
ncbi:acetyltransferase [Pleionea sp. CnH1-48]|uniref:acetyltransferase n=1 Tax=Pleionea sp. CnH1-48 TaxID=2954494 RepID=UPI002097361F|nr:acetyltransferase [Pleionea sp. CnH1-48]MCO7223783.1 acetyltransferase [Pleionea sp. CnH1-48]